MGWKSFFWAIVALVLIALLAFYWFFPLNTVDFGTTASRNSNFSLNASLNTSMQFYPNMRYPGPNISYKILNCAIQKTDDMKTAFNIIENITRLTFYPVNSNEEISVSCDSRTQVQGRLIIAGEGGPVNITESGNFNVIFHGSILLLRESNCEMPNIAIHELLHALGFNHSQNPNNVMYPVTACSQTIGQDTIDTINQIYSFPTLPDLYFENASATMSGRYVNLNMTVRNIGLNDASASVIDVYGDGNLIHEINLGPLGIGQGREIIVTNVFVLKPSISELTFSIKTNYEELDKQNNEAVLKI